MKSDLGGGKEILVRAVKRQNESAVGCLEHVFYKFDIETLESETALKPCCPSLLNKHGNYNAVMVKLGGSSIIYVIGNLDPNASNSKQEEEEVEDPSSNSIGSLACLNRASWIDLSENHPKWRSAPCPTHNPWSPLCVSICGKIYSLGDLACKLEVYNHPNTLNENQHATENTMDNDNGGSIENNDNTENVTVKSGGGGFWVELPPPPSEIRSSHVSFNPIPDPEHARIIAHINSAIYAFKPNRNNQWERLSRPDRDFIYWHMCSVVADGVLCIAHDGLIRSITAFDLADSTRKLQVEWSNTYPDHIRELEFDVLINLGNRFLCLAIYTPIYRCIDLPALFLDRTRIYLAVFSFKRQAHRLVTFTYQCYRYYDLFDVTSVIDYVALGE